jgi:uncharacterized membrane protein YbhN (UPF0104 family)
MARRLARITLLTIAIAALAILIAANRSELPAAGRALRGASVGWLLAGAATLTAWWLAWLLLHLACRSAARVGGYAEAGRLLPVTVGAIALNTILKSGGMAGMALFLADAKRRRLPPGRVGAAYLLAATLAEVAFSVTLLAAVTVVWFDGRLTRVDVLAVCVFLIFLVLRGTALVAALRSREMLRQVLTAPARIWDRLRGRPGRTPDTATADDLYGAIELVRDRPADGLPALGFAIGIDMFGALILWASLAAVGGGNRPIVALVAYAISGLFGIVGFLPGGVGFVEVGAATVLASFGVPVGVATAAVVVFRVWEFWVPVALGSAAAWWLRRPAHVDEHTGDVIAEVS